MSEHENGTNLMQLLSQAGIQLGGGTMLVADDDVQYHDNPAILIPPGLRVIDSDKEQRFQLVTGENLGDNDYKWDYAKK